MSNLKAHIHAAPLPAHDRPVMVQVGWLGHRDGTVYGLHEDPLERHAREHSFGMSPLYIQIGSWEHLGDGKMGIRD
jgi:hypothetical protein